MWECFEDGAFVVVESLMFTSLGGTGVEISQNVWTGEETSSEKVWFLLSLRIEAKAYSESLETARRRLIMLRWRSETFLEAYQPAECVQHFGNMK